MVIRRRIVWSVSGDRFPAWAEIHLHTACNPAVGFTRPLNAAGTGEQSGRRVKLITARSVVGGYEYAKLYVHHSLHPYDMVIKHRVSRNGMQKLSLP
jgi:hypothetical protein